MKVPDPAPQGQWGLTQSDPSPFSLLLSCDCKKAMLTPSIYGKKKSVEGRGQTNLCPGIQLPELVPCSGSNVCNL